MTPKTKHFKRYKRCYKVLIVDLIGMSLDDNAQPDFSEVQQYIESIGGVFHLGPGNQSDELSNHNVHFYYCPNLSHEAELVRLTNKGQFDAVIAAATYIPPSSVFKYGGVRIGAGTANMASDSWREINGVQGAAPLMNTPSFNSRATAQAVFKAILNVLPDMAVEEMHALVMAGAFDTARDLIKFPTSKLEGKRLAIIGYGNIGREVAKIGAAFGMQVVIFARQKHKRWIESEGFEYASAIQDAAREADILSPHIGLGAYQCDTKNYANSHFINAEIFAVMRQGAVLINYDRGEIVDTQALASALETGRVRFAAIDADIFVDSNSEVTGPLARYRALAQKHPQKLQLLPHAAADTEHISRVEGAKQAVAQIMAVIESKKVTNLVGSLPIGYFDNGAKTVIGVGKVLAKDFKALSEKQIQEMQDNSLAMLNFWQNLSQAQDATSKALLIDLHAQTFLLKANTYTNMLRNNGLQGPYEQ